MALGAFAALQAILQFHTADAISSLNVDTTSGSVQGFRDDVTPNVAQFLGIPFAEQPVGARRWLPPSLKSKEHGTIDATRFGHYIISRRDYQGEDCLSFNLWTPWNETNYEGDAVELLPVIAWIFGRGFQTGGGTVPYQNPSRWVERTGKHIVVGINYRVNIFGFPNAASLPIDEQNPGLLDQRLDLEWIRDNIANFGGDPERITLWGQSAGAMSVDDYNFAYPDDPIVSGLIMNSGTSLLPLGSADVEQTNFNFVAQHFGCNNDHAEADIDCLRKVDASSIIDYLKGRANNGTLPSLAFNHIIDNGTTFSNYTARALAGNFTRKPAIIGTNINEGISLIPYNRTYGPSQKIADATTAQLFLCLAVKTTQDRYAANTTTFRYLYGGNFSNIAPLWWEGAYHASDLPMLFGTYGIARGEGTESQKEVSEKMQDYWLAFAPDPVNGLPELGWDAYDPSGEAVLFGYEEQVV